MSKQINKRKRTNGILLYVLGVILALSFVGNCFTIKDWSSAYRMGNKDVGSLVMSNILIGCLSVVCLVNARKNIKNSKHN